MPPPWLNAMRSFGWREAMPPVIIEAQARATSPGKHTACSAKAPTMRSWPAGRSACTKIEAPRRSASAKNGSKRASPIDTPLTWLAISTPENFSFWTTCSSSRMAAVDVLQRNAAQADEALRRRGDHARDLVVEEADHHLGVVERQPVGQQLGHRRDRLARDAHRAHLLDAARHAPAAIGHRAVELAGDHHVAMAGVRRRHRRPGHVLAFTGVRRKVLRDDVGVDVDAFGHKTWSVPVLAC